MAIAGVAAAAPARLHHGIRAQAYDYGAPELVELELYVMSRARGMAMEAPAVRP